MTSKFFLWQNDDYFKTIRMPHIKSRHHQAHITTPIKHFSDIIDYEALKKYKNVEASCVLKFQPRRFALGWEKVILWLEFSWKLV